MGMSPTLMRPRNAVLNPKTITGLYAWYDASDASSVTLNGMTISQINDKSGNGRNLTQSTASLQPVYKSNGIKGRSVISPDGVDDTLSLGTVTAYKPKYIIGVFMPISTNGGPWVHAGGLNDGIGVGQGATTHDNDGLNIVALHDAVAWKNSALAMTQNAGVILSYKYETCVFRSFPYGNADLADAVIVDATGLSLCGYATTSRYTDGYIGEVLIYTTVPSTTDESRIEKYLGAKWGVSGT